MSSIRTPRSVHYFWSKHQHLPICQAPEKAEVSCANNVNKTMSGVCFWFLFSFLALEVQWPAPPVWVKTDVLYTHSVRYIGTHPLRKTRTMYNLYSIRLFALVLIGRSNAFWILSLTGNIAYSAFCPLVARLTPAMSLDSYGGISGKKPSWVLCNSCWSTVFDLKYAEELSET